MTDHVPYLVALNERLAAAVADWPARRRDTLADAIVARQADNGGFAGRAGGGDLYYTAFALRALAILDRLREPTAVRASAFLAGCRPANLIDVVSLLAARWVLARRNGPDIPNAAELGGLIERFRCDDGGYAKVPGGTSSTYHSFLAALGHDLLGQAQPDGPALGRFALRRVRDDGGFAELAAVGHSSVNPTAAGTALVAAAELDGAAGIDAATAGRIYDGAANFLLAAQRDDGGWPASPRTPASDLLSTFTAGLTLADLGRLDEARTAAAAGFAAACEIGRGWYGAAPDDRDGDVEYVFYGLGCAAILT